jgi:polysaccharide biosynthesis protein PslH
MKILWVKAGGLVPPDSGGRIRSYHLLRELAQTHEVILFTFYGQQPEDPHADLGNVFTRVEYRPLSLPKPGSLGIIPAYARCFLSLKPYTIAKFCRPRVRQDLRNLLSEETYDVIVCDFAVAGGVIPWRSPCPKVLFTHNVEAQIWKRHVQVARNPVWKAICWREYWTMSRAERFYLRRADHVLTVSEGDRAFFSQFVEPAKITVIPTGVDLNYFRPDDTVENPHSLVFTGSMDWLANVDGVFYFVEQVLPLIRGQFPDVSFSVVGRRPTPQLRDLARKTAGLRVTGSVEDVRPYIREAAVYVVPLRVGGGTRLKIFEAMAMGKAVVSTPVGAEGLDVEDDVDIMLADSPARFADAVIELLGDDPLRRRIGQAAAQRASQYSWSRIADGLGKVLSDVVQTTKQKLEARN